MIRDRERDDEYVPLVTGYKSSVIRLKGKPQNGCYKKAKHAKFSGVCMCISGDKNVCFSDNLVCCFLVTLVLRFAILPYCRRNMRRRINIFTYVSVNIDITMLICDV